MGIWDIFTPDAGQKRRQWLNQNVDTPINKALSYYMGAGNSLPQALGLLADSNPIAGLDRAGTQSQDIFAADKTPMERLISTSNMLSETAGAGLGLLGAPAASKIGADVLTDVATRVSKNAKKAGDFAATDMVGAARAIGSGDMDFLTGWNSPQSARAAGADVVRQPLAGAATPYADIPVIDPRDIIGAKYSPILADLTKAGGHYQGIDASGTMRDTPLMGGPLFPAQQTYRDANVAWLTDSASAGSKILNKDSDYTVVHAMGKKAHQSNATVADSVLGTMEAYIRDGRLPSKNLAVMTDKIRDFGKNTVNKDLKPLEDFIGFDDSNVFDYMQNTLTFPQREAVSKQLQSPAFEALGAPNMQKVLDSTIQPEFAGTNLHDALLVLELDKKRGLLDLAQEGLPLHPSYSTGIGGKIVGRFENPAAREFLYPNFTEQYGSRPTMRQADGSIDEARMAYSFGRVSPIEKLNADQARNLHEAVQYHNIAQPQQAQMIEQAIAGSWKTSGVAKTKGGIAPVDFERALKRSPSYASLEPYTASDVKIGSKSGDFKVYQLGENDLYFGLKKSPDYSWMGDVPEIGPKDIDLVAVVSNEIGARGVASPAVMGKAIEEGASVLNAFAVPSKQYPDGFLPNVYGGYGFEEVKRIPFSKEYYISDRGQAAYDDLLRQWKSDGWTEDMGFPDVVAMKWKGLESERANAAKAVFNKDFRGFGGGKDSGTFPAPENISKSGIRQADETQGISGQDFGRRNTGGLLASAGSSKPNRIRAAATEIDNLLPSQRRNLGLLPR